MLKPFFCPWSQDQRVVEIGGGPGLPNSERPIFRPNVEGRPGPMVDIVHDLEQLPYPLPDKCCVTILASHIMEHLDPRRFIDIMDELWRVMKPDGQLLISTPYAGTPGFWQDPTHIHGYNEATWTYFDPELPLYQVYRPKPWRIERNT